MENRFIDFDTDKPIIPTGLTYCITYANTSSSLKFKFVPIFNQFYQFLRFSVKPVETGFEPIFETFCKADRV
jgi:hypothetical protein